MIDGAKLEEMSDIGQCGVSMAEGGGTYTNAQSELWGMDAACWSSE